MAFERRCGRPGFAGTVMMRETVVSAALAPRIARLPGALPAALREGMAGVLLAALVLAAQPFTPQLLPALVGTAALAAEPAPRRPPFAGRLAFAVSPLRAA